MFYRCDALSAELKTARSFLTGCLSIRRICIIPYAFQKLTNWHQIKRYHFPFGYISSCTLVLAQN